MTATSMNWHEATQTPVLSRGMRIGAFLAMPGLLAFAGVGASWLTAALAVAGGLSLTLAGIAGLRLWAGRRDGVSDAPSATETIAGTFLVLSLMFTAAAVVAPQGVAVGLVAGAAVLVVAVVLEFVVASVIAMLVARVGGISGRTSVYAIALHVQQKFGGPLGSPLPRR